MESAIYSGWVRHRRESPTHHAFTHRLFMVYLDLAELDDAFRGRWLWSASRPALAWFRRADHMGDHKAYYGVLWQWWNSATTRASPSCTAPQPPSSTSVTSETFLNPPALIRPMTFITTP